MVSNQRKAFEFIRLVAHAQETADPEEQIIAREAALKLESELKSWPLEISRERFKGIFLGGLGISYQKRDNGDREDNIERAIVAFHKALSIFTREAFPTQWAVTQVNLASSYCNRIRGDRAENFERAINACEASLSLHTRELYPREWAAAKSNLALAYLHRVRGDRAENLEQALKIAHEVLTVLTRETLPEEWAKTTVKLGGAYLARIKGERSDNVEHAIEAYEAALSVFTREAFPTDWALTLTSLGTAYRDRIFGGRTDNIERAIEAYEAALTVYTRGAFPGEWAEIQNTLAITHWYRVQGERTDNIERAIKGYEAALTVKTPEVSPKGWAEIQCNLGNAYAVRIRGERADNVEQAIKAYEAALSVLTEDASPREWASTTVNLGNALAEGTQGHRADYFERAIEAYKGALSVFTREEFPTDWATTQNNLGGAFAGRIKGQRAENLEQAIKAYKAALTVRTRDAFPQDWAASQHNLGNAYLSRIKGQRANNLERATKAYETALSVFTLEASPRDHMRTACKCGRAFLFKREWALASAMYASASEAFLLLFGQGLDEDEARDLIANIGPLFAEAAYVAAEIGKQEIALSLLNEGKARLLALALREQKLDLAPEKQARHVALKTEIRQLIRIAQLEGGIRGMEAINQLRELRRELGRLLKEGGVRSSAGGVMALARVVLPLHGAIVAPIITDVGAKIVIVAAPREEDCSITVLDLPELTNDVLEKLLRGDGTVGATGGWLGAYAIQGLPWQRQEALIDEWRAAVEDIGPKLWILFAGRLDIELQERGVRPGARLTWLPAGALGFLPLGLARDASTGRLFTDIYEVNQAPSLEALVYATQRLVTTSPASLVAVVNPTGDIPKLDLPFAEIEGALVASHFDGDHLISLDKSNATPAAVLAALRGKTYWHFSTHGSFNWKDVRQSAIFLKGKAPLTVGALRETEGSLGRPRLVVLSACETGLYDITHSPDEFVGLPATLMQIGASGVLGTLWQVDDLATALFISKFYDLHIDEGLAPVSALQRAQIWFRQATKAELLAYSKAAAAHAKLNASALTAIEASLKSRRRSSATIFAAIWNTLQEKIANASRDSAPGDENLQSPPFEHPYYWGGFVYTGV